MPTYEYQCNTCEQVFDVFQSMSARRLTKCPDKACKGRVKRLLGKGAGVIFKGSGFYETDYRSESYKESAKNDQKSSEPKSESKSETKTETKAETKTPPAKKDSTTKSKPAAKSSSKSKGGS